MSEQEYMSIAGAIHELSKKMDGLQKDFNDMRVDIVEKYATKEQLEKRQNNNTAVLFNVLTLLGAATAIIVSIVR